MLICTKRDCKCFHHLLLDCIKMGLNDESKALLKNQNNICHVADKRGLTLLHHSAEYGNKAMVQYLLDQGCKIDAQDGHGFTPLALAIRKRDVEIVMLLLKNNADIYLTDNNGWSSYQFAFQCCLYWWSRNIIRPNLSLILEMLFERVNRDFLTNTRAMMQVMSNANDTSKLATVLFGNVVLSRFVLKNDYAIDFRVPEHGYAALHCAVIFARIESAKMLIQCGANVDAVDKRGKTPLHDYVYNCEASDENSEVLKMLLQSGTEFSELKIDGVAHLLRFGSTETARAVLESGFDRRTTFSDGRSHLHLLIENKNVDIYELEVELDIDFKNAPCPRGQTLLTIAARCGFVRKVEFLLQRGADVHSSSGNECVLCSVGIDVDSTNIEKLRNHMAITELLLQRGADAQLAFGVDAKSYLDYMYLCRKSDVLADIVVAHLAMVDRLDRSSLSDKSRKIIQFYSEFKDHFDLCRQQLENMRNIEVHGKISLFELLIETDEKKVVACARNEEFISAFNSTIENTPLKLYYFNFLRRRVKSALDKIELNRKAALALETLTGLCCEGYHLILRKIITYLDLMDLNNLCEANRHDTITD